MFDKRLNVYSVKGIKKFIGMEGMGGFNLTLCKNNKPIAFVINEDCGGAYLWRWQDEEARKEFNKLAKSCPPESYEGMSIAVDDDMLLDKIVELLEIQKKCKKFVCFVLKDNKDSIYQYKITSEFSEEYLIGYARKQYGDRVEVIYNEALRW
jgi:hypothetical protein